MSQMDLSILPSINAGLNFTSALLLTLGYFFVRQKALTAHTMCMLAACGTSTLFLISYLYYHFHHGATKFPGHGPVKFVYLMILFSHTILAVTIVPMILRTLYHGFSSNFHRHVKIARKTLPLWFYVSVTGVFIYWMLYHVYGVAAK